MSCAVLASPNALKQEDARLEALDRYDVLGTPREEAFDRISRIARKAFNVPVALVSFIDAHRQWYKAVDGLSTEEVPLNETFCKNVLLSGEPFIAPDASADPSLANHPLVVNDPHIRFYAGMPIRTPEGHIIGTFCIIDFVARTFPSDQLELMAEIASVAMDELELRRTAGTDELTGAVSRRAFKEYAIRMTGLALRHHQDLSCIALDLDRFKSVNDSYGHEVGDRVLAAATQACAAQLRGTDVIGRLGGEEFAVLLPNTNQEGALLAAEKLRSAIEEADVDAGGVSLKITGSFGISSLGPTVRDVEALLHNADQALYVAKNSGRNRIAVAPSEGFRQPMRRVLKGGKILFNDGASTMDCTVRSLSEEGVGLDISSSVGVPKRFSLLIRSDDIQKDCRIISRSDTHIEAIFC